MTPGQTGCLPAAALSERLEEEINRAGRHGTTLSCLLVVIDNIEEFSREQGGDLPEQVFAYLARALERHPPPAIHGRRVRVRYIAQPKTRPPTFALFGTQLKALPESYLRYLQNELRAAFPLEGTPIRFSLRTTANPYAGK